MARHIILGVHITERIRKAQRIQELLTEYGCNIHTRIGLHPVGEDVCSPNGLILLEMAGEEAKAFELADKLAQIEGVFVKNMVFDHL
jgi:hypothetical protein